MNSAKELLTEYTAITGRPLATISVSEFLEFKKYSEGMAVPISMQVEMSKYSQPVTTREPLTQVVPISDKREEKIAKTDTSENKPKKSSAFAMMKSIGG